MTGGYFQQEKLMVVRGQLDMSGNLMGVQHVYNERQCPEFWGYGRFIYFLDMDPIVVITREDALDHLWEVDPRNFKRERRLPSDPNYSRRPGENIKASSDTLPFVEAYKSGEVPTRSCFAEIYRGRGFGRGQEMV